MVLADQRQNASNKRQAKHDELHSKCHQVNTITATMKEKFNGLQKTVATMAKQLIAAGEQVPAAQLIIQAHEAAKQEHREAEMKLDAHKERVTTILR